MNDVPDLVAEIEALEDKLALARASITKRFIGQERVVDLTLSALLCGGHALLIGAPGLAKTRLVESMGTALGLNASRIQFTPDLMPSDILGSEVLDESASGERSSCDTSCSTPRACTTRASMRPAMWSNSRASSPSSSRACG